MSRHKFPALFSIAMLSALVIIIASLGHCRSLSDAGSRNETTPDTLQQSASEVRRVLEQHVQVQQEIYELARSRSPTPRSHPQEKPESDPAPNATHERKRQTTRSLPRLFKAAPLAVTTDDLVWHNVLNPLGHELGADQLRILERLIALNQRGIQDAVNSRSQAQHALLKQRVQAGELLELGRDSVPESVWNQAERRVRASRATLENSGVPVSDIPRERRILAHLELNAREFIPGARAFIDIDGRSFIALDSQLQELAPFDEYIDYLKEDFLASVSGFFVAQGFAPPESARRLVEEIRQLLAKNQ